MKAYLLEKFTLQGCMCLLRKCLISFQKEMPEYLHVSRSRMREWHKPLIAEQEGGSCLGTHVRIKDFKIKKNKLIKKKKKTWEKKNS